MKLISLETHNSQKKLIFHMHNHYAKIFFALIALTSFSKTLYAQENSPQPKSIHASFINLIANPDQYDGKLVFLDGYLDIQFEHSSFCPLKNNISSKDCLWLYFDSSPYESESDFKRFQKREKLWKRLFNKKMVSIRGYFDKEDQGHFDQWSGSIRNVVDVYSRDATVSFGKDGEVTNLVERPPSKHR